ncbi:MAG TPA: hypothetical protein PLV92_20980 [Pirellulaceae bacterium]|nr:hypothetical protein [Pirellulaceae bacterium]
MTAAAQVVLLVVISVVTAGLLVGILALLGWSLWQDSEKQAEARRWRELRRELNESIKARKVKP